MAEIVLEEVSKVYADSVRAVDAVSLVVEDGESSSS
jgi:ABC-type Na+ transport system ATPase subunit NatA